MAELRFSKHINAPPEIVCALATDFERLPEVIRGIKRVEMLTPGPVGLSTRFREARMMFGREAIEEMEVTTYDPPRKFTLRSESYGCRFVCEHKFVPDIAGTLVEVTIRTQPLTMMARLMAPISWVMTGSVRQLIESDLNDLKRAAEQRAPVDWRQDPTHERRGYEISGA